MRASYRGDRLYVFCTETNVVQPVPKLKTAGTPTLHFLRSDVLTASYGNSWCW